MYTAPQPPGRSGRGRALLYGGITFALVFLLIVGVVVAYLVVRTVTAGGDPTAGPATSVSTTDTPAETASVEVTEEERCWSAPYERPSSNPGGTLRGGGLQFTPPATFDGRHNEQFLSFMDDSATATAKVAGTWNSTVTVGRVHWQDGYEYPGAEAAAERITDCLLSHPSAWGDTSGRTEQNRTGEAVEIDGMPGYQVTVDYMFAKGPSEDITGSAITVVVVDTPEGPSVFCSDASIGQTEHEQGTADALASLTGIS